MPFSNEVGAGQRTAGGRDKSWKLGLLLEPETGRENTGKVWCGAAHHLRSWATEAQVPLGYMVNLRQRQVNL